MFLYLCEIQPLNGQCPDPMWLPWSELASFSVSQLDPAIVAAAFGAGFGTVAFLSVVGMACGAVLKALR
tara:strand:- start:5157 stop:5363 length:207 start_codon:yes stop_codon:yes gene_type:complete